MIKRIKNPDVRVKQTSKGCFISVKAGHFWEYEFDYDEHLLIIYIGESEWEYDVPVWIDETKDIVETDKSIEVVR